MVQARDQGTAPRLTQLQRRGHAFAEEHLLNSALLRGEFLNNIAEAMIDRFQPLRMAITDGADAATCHVAQAIT